MQLESLTRRYRGAVAADYDQSRISEEKWVREQKVMSLLLASIAPGSRLLDVPIGTGRLIVFYKEYGHLVTGVDVSADMLREAEAKADALRLELELAEGDIRNLALTSNSFDVAICLRLFNLIDMPTLEVALKELARVSRSLVIVGVRFAVPLPELIVTRGGLLRGIRRQVKHVRRWYMKRGMFLHRRQDVLAAFESNGLIQIMSSVVESSSDGSEYYIYLLEKRDRLA